MGASSSRSPAQVVQLSFKWVNWITIDNISMYNLRTSKEN